MSMGYPCQPYLESTTVLSDYEQSDENAQSLRAHIFKTTWLIFFRFEILHLDLTDILLMKFESSSSNTLGVNKERSLYYVNGTTVLREY